MSYIEIAGWTGKATSGGLISRHDLGSTPSPASNSKAKGERTEGIILGLLMRKGYVVLLPFGNNQRYDLVYDDGIRMWKCQCKTGKWKNGTIIFNACSTNGFTGKKRGYRGQIDFFLVYCDHVDRVYRIPVGAITERIARLRVDPVLRNKARCKWASTYEL